MFRILNNVKLEEARMSFFFYFSLEKSTQKIQKNL